jgi:hypothetical protein
MPLRNLGLCPAAVALAVAGAACSDALAPEDLAGSYRASVFELTSVETPSKKEDWVAAGVNVSFVIGADGSFSLTVTWDERTTLDASGLNWEYSGATLSGTIAIDGSTVTISLPNPGADPDELIPASGPISRSGDTLTWTLTCCVTRDFGDGTEEPITLRVVGTRTT